MHLPDGFINNNINLITAGISLPFLAYCIHKANNKIEDKIIPILGVTGAFIFAAQMLNFPVLGGASGHFLGAFLAAVLLGPLNAGLVMGVVLIIQCLAFGDGGITSLGTNYFNMYMVAGLIPYGLFKITLKIVPSNKQWFSTISGIFAWFSVVLSSFVCALEISLSQIAPAKLTITSMVGFHLIIGIGEAVITGFAISLLLKTRPDIVSSFKPQLSANQVYNEIS
jgi:cobalt/nickel transport system permease protein